jgi:hypothetical protein
VCQYSTPCLLSSEKHATASDAEVEGRAGDTSGAGTTAAAGGGYRPLPEPLVVISRMAKSAISRRLRTFWRSYACEALLERLPQDLEDMVAALGPFIREANPVVGQRHLPRHRHLAPPISPTVDMV